MIVSKGLNEYKTSFDRAILTNTKNYYIIIIVLSILHVAVLVSYGHYKKVESLGATFAVLLPAILFLLCSQKLFSFCSVFKAIFFLPCNSQQNCALRRANQVNLKRLVESLHVVTILNKGNHHLALHNTAN